MAERTPQSAAGSCKSAWGCLSCFPHSCFWKWVTECFPAADFGYFGGRAYYFGKACTKARGLSDGYLNACMEVLFRTNRLMNSSKTDSRLLLERAFTEISALKGARV